MILNSPTRVLKPVLCQNVRSKLALPAILNSTALESRIYHYFSYIIYRSYPTQLYGIFYFWNGIWELQNFPGGMPQEPLAGWSSGPRPWFSWSSISFSRPFHKNLKRWTDVLHWEILGSFQHLIKGKNSVVNHCTRTCIIQDFHSVLNLTHAAWVFMTNFVMLHDSSKTRFSVLV